MESHQRRVNYLMQNKRIHPDLRGQADHLVRSSYQAGTQDDGLKPGQRRRIARSRTGSGHRRMQGVSAPPVILDEAQSFSDVFARPLNLQRPDRVHVDQVNRLLGLVPTRRKK